MVKKSSIFKKIFCTLLFVSFGAFLLTGCGKEDKTTTITYKWNDEVYFVQTVDNGSIVTPLDDPQKPGYTFLGWFTDEEKEYRFNPNMYTPNGQELTLYAKYTLNAYAINYHLGEGETTSNPETINIETSLTLQPGVKEGYRFMGWYSDENFTNQQTTISEGTLFDLDLYPRFLKLYSITYHGVDVLDGWPTEFTEEDSVLLPIAPNKESEEFYCWSTEYNVVRRIAQIPLGTTNDIVLFPKYYAYASISYDIGTEGTNNDLNPTKLSVFNDNIIYDPIVKPGFEFIEWELSGYPNAQISREEDRTVLRFTEKRAEKISLRAKYRVFEYRIGYYLNGGINSESNPSLYTAYTSYVLQNPTRSGYAFVGWYTEETFENLITEIKHLTGNLVLYAKWVKLNNQNAYEINTVDDLRMISGLNSFSYDIVLNADIDLQGEAITILKYSGVFDGNNHTIKNCSAPVFAIVEDATIKNTNATININTVREHPSTSWMSRVGFVGCATDSTIVNCNVEGSISISLARDLTFEKVYVAGLVGYVWFYESTSIIKQCSSDVNIEIINQSDVIDLCVGGLIGEMHPSAEVENCYSSGNIFIKVLSPVYPCYSYIGGLIGSVHTTYYMGDCGSIKNSYSTTNVKLDCNNEFSGRDMNLGGFIGYLQSGGNTNVLISQCYATGNVEICNKENNEDYYKLAYTRGFIGFTNIDAEYIQNCFVFNGQTIVGGHSNTNKVLSKTMEEIWEYVLENWDADIWNLSTTENPTLK